MPPAYYMACIDLTGRRVLVVGGGRWRSRRSQGLLAAGRRRHGRRAADHAGPRRARTSRSSAAGYRTEDLDGAFLVVAATSTTSVNRRVFRDAEAR